MNDNRRKLFTIYEDELNALMALPHCSVQDNWQDDWETYSIEPYAISPLEQLFCALIDYQTGVPEEEIMLNITDSGAKNLFAIKKKEIDDHD